MSSRALLPCVFVVLSACSESGGAHGGPLTDDDPSTVRDAGSTDADTDQSLDEEEPTADAGDVDEEEPPVVSDAGASDDAGAADAGPKDPIREIIDTVAEFTTCKPHEINPIIDCFTMTCAGDLLALPGCLLSQCAPLIDKVNPKCKECVVAGVNQDTTGLLENCVDVGGGMGGEMSGGGLPF